MLRFTVASDPELKTAPPPRDARQVREGIERAREQIAASAAALKEEMASKVDWRGWVRKRPYTFLLGAVAFGFVIGSRRSR